MNLKIITKIGLALLLIVSLIFVIALTDRYFNGQINETTEELHEDILPRAIMSLSILERFGDINSNVLEYVSGEEEEKEHFTNTVREIKVMLAQMKNLPDADAEHLEEIEELVVEYDTRIRNEVFGTYSPTREREAQHAVVNATEKTGKPLEELLDRLKESEISDAGNVVDIKVILEDDLPGVQYYLELVDEAGDMISDLNAYLSSDNPEENRNSFSTNALSFKEYLGKLQPLEAGDSNDMQYLNQVDLLFTALYTAGISIMNDYDPTNKQDALRAIDELEHDVLEDLQRILDASSSGAAEGSKIHVETLIRITRMNEQVILGVLLLILFFGILIVYYTYSTVLKPITLLNQNILDLSEGKSDITIFGLTQTDEIGALANAVQKFRDSTEQRVKMERQLMEEKIKAEEATQYKSDFLANMSHEIRTPMNAITGLLSLVLKTDLTDRQFGYLRKINYASKNLLGILNDILDFSKIEAGKLDIEKTRFNFNDVLQNLSMFLIEKNEEKELELIYQITPDVPFELLGDSLRLGQVLLNLTSNAMKFTSRGEIILSVNVISKDREDIVLAFQVKDTGIGMDSKVLNTIFQPFVQADHSHTRRFGGTGLGLAITRQLVDLMGGELKVTSDVGRGTIFSFTLPFKTFGAESPFIAAHINDMAGQKILVADSNSISREVAEELFDSLKMVPRVVDSGKQAVTLYKKELETNSPFNMVMLDWNLQDISCIDTAEQILTNDNENNPFLLFSSSSSRESVLDRLEKFNANGLVQKPYTRSTIFDSIVGVLGKEGLIQEYNKIQSNDSLDSLEAFAGSRILVAEDNEINREVINDILVDMGMTVDLVENGEEAVEYLQTSNVTDLVLMDIQMPKMDGLEATAAIRKIAHRKTTPIIALTAHALLSQKKQCLEIGMNDHISKPIEQRELIQKLSRWLPIKGSRDGESEPEQNKSVKTMYTIPNISAANAIERFGGSETLFLKILKKFIDDKNSNLISNLEYASSHNNYDAISKAAHALKGTAGTIGAMKLSLNASELERSYQEGQENTELLEIVLKQYQALKEDIQQYFDSEETDDGETLPVELNNTDLMEKLKELLVMAKDNNVESSTFFSNTIEGSTIGKSKDYQKIKSRLDEYEFGYASEIIQHEIESLSEGHK